MVDNPSTSADHQSQGATGSGRIAITRDGVGPVVIDCTQAVVAAPAGWDVATTQVHAPKGWEAQPLDGQAGQWRIVPQTVPTAPSVTVACTAPGGAWEAQTLPITLDLRSAFEPQRFAFLKRNRAQDIGTVEPRRDLLQRTYRLLPPPLSTLLYHGLYRDIVYLREGPRRGGLCSGMARWAVARWQGDEPPARDDRHAVERIQLYHGRQLRDRALLSAFPWLLRGSPTAAYATVRREMLLHGGTARSLDLAVPKLWRKDVFNAIVSEGHSVVPYALTQTTADEGLVSVYDPNHPAALSNGTPRQITFDLRRNRYAYGKMATLDESGLGMIAVHQRAYREPGTAFLATLASAAWAPTRRILGAAAERAGQVREARDAQIPAAAEGVPTSPATQ